MIKAQQGDQHSLGVLFERYKRVLFQFFYNLYNHAEVSEDLVQNVFIRVIRYKSKFNGEGEFKNWMFAIARNVSHDYLRKQKRKNTESIEAWEEKILDDVDLSGDIIQQEELALLRIALQRLDSEKREIIVLSKLEGMKYQNIAKLLDCTEGAVKAKVFRAMKSLKQVYSELAAKV